MILGRRYKALVQRKRMSREDESSVCLRARQSRSGSHSSAEKQSEAVKYCVGRTTDPNTALKSRKKYHKVSPGETECQGATQAAHCTCTGMYRLRGNNAHTYTEAYDIQWYLNTLIPRTHAARAQYQITSDPL